MRQVITLFFLFFGPSILIAAPLPDYSPLLTYILFPGGLEVIDGRTVLVTANGINKEISLNGTWEDDEKGKEILEKMIAGRSTEVRIYGWDKDNRTVGVLFAEGENITRKLTGQGFAQKIFHPGYNGIGKNTPLWKGVRIPSSSNSVSSSGGDSRKKTQRVSAYTRKDGTRVESYMRAPAQSGENYRKKTQYVRGHWRNGTWVESYMRAPARR